MSAPTNKPKSDAPPRPPFSDITNNPSSAPEGAAPPVKPNPQTPAHPPGSTAARLAELRSAWERKTPGEKAAWNQETFGTPGPPWAGEVSYDDGADVEYEERMRKGGVA